MSENIYSSKPPLKVGEWPTEQGGMAYIYFEEFIDVPGLEKAGIRFEFDKNNTFDEIQDLVSRLKNSGFTFVVQI